MSWKYLRGKEGDSPKGGGVIASLCGVETKMASFCQIVKLETRSPGPLVPFNPLAPPPSPLQAIATISTPPQPHPLRPVQDVGGTFRRRSGITGVSSRCNVIPMPAFSPPLSLAWPEGANRRGSVPERLLAGRTGLCVSDRLWVLRGWGVERQPGCSSVFLPWLNVEPVDGQSWCCPNSVLLCMPQQWGLTLGGLGV